MADRQRHGKRSPLTIVRTLSERLAEVEEARAYAIRRAVDAGLSLREVAAAAGLHHSTVARIVSER